MKKLLNQMFGHTGLYLETYMGKKAISVIVCNVFWQVPSVSIGKFDFVWQKAEGNLLFRKVLGISWRP